MIGSLFSFGHGECEVPMSSASKRSLLDCPDWPRALSGVKVGKERLLWAGRPVLAGVAITARSLRATVAG